MRWTSLALAALLLPACAGRQLRETTYSGPPLQRDELERLAAAGISEPVLNEVLQSRGAAPLKAEDLVAIKAAGASDSIVQRAIALERKEPEVVYVEEVRYRYDPWTWGVGFGWGWYGGWHGPRVGVGVRIVR